MPGSDEAAQRVDLGLEFFWRQLTVARRQEARVGAFLHSDKVHVFELAGVRAGPHFLQNVGKDLTNRAPWFFAQLVQSQRSDEDAFELVPPQQLSIGEWR